MTVVLSMNPLCSPHHRLCGEEVLSPDISYSSYLPHPPRADTTGARPDTPTMSPAIIDTSEEIRTSPLVSDKTDTDIEVDSNSLDCRGVKRKLPLDVCDNEKVPSKRISPFLNTPKQRKDERRKVLKLSIQKLRQMEDPEQFLRRSVLINNTVKKMQSEIREEKRTNGVSKGYPLYKRKYGYDYEVLNNSYLSSAQCFDEVVPTADDNIMCDDVTDALVQSLETGNFTSTETPIENFTTDSQREKQIYSDMDTVFNNLIRALGET